MSPSRRELLRGAADLAAGAIATACGASSRKASSPSATHTQPATRRPVPPSPTATPPDPAAIKANELGMVPILMHHRVVDHVDSEYDMTPAYFRAELERLEAEGYFPVQTIDLARGDLGHVPAGRHPLVLTFDDSSSGQMGYTATGTIPADSAVGVMLDFAREHPQFPITASFYINKNPFAVADTAKVLADLHRRGFEIGNHTFDHVNLGTVDAAHVQNELARLAQLVSSQVPGLVPTTMALPNGVDPHPSMLAAGGTANGTTYRNEAVLLVGANPSRSPFHTKFDPIAVPRIRSSSYDGGTGDYLATYWLDYLAKHPDDRYTAAGNPGKVTFPQSAASSLAPAYAARAVTYST